MQREFVIVYKAKPEYKVQDVYLSCLRNTLPWAFAQIEEAVIFDFKSEATGMLTPKGYLYYDDSHEPGVVMEKITTISLKPVD